MGMVYAEEIEGAVLGACLLERSAQAVVLKSLRAEMFYLTAHRVVFEAINALYARGAAVDMLTVTEELRAQGQLDDAGGPFAVAKLAAGVATSAHLEYHCSILFQYYLRRKLVEVLTRELAAANDMTCDVYDVLIDTQRELGALLEDSPLENHLHPMPEVMGDTVALVDRRQELAVNGLTGVPTGLQRLNEMTGGWQPGNLIFTAGRPAMGKTQLGLKFAMEAASRGYHVLLFTLEMMSEEVGERLLLMRTPGLYAKVKGGRVTQQELDELFRQARELDNCPLLVDDKAYLGIDQLCAEARMVHSRYRVDLVVVDYLQLLGVTERAGRNREQEVAECSRKLKRQVEQTFNQRPELKHLRESGAIEQDADMVLMLCRSERDRRKSGLILAKNRHGEASKPNSCIELELF